MSSWQAAEVATVHAGPHRVVYRALGAGPTIVLVHSGGLSARQWRRLAEPLSDRYRVVLPDLIGYGGSTPWPESKPFAFTRDVDAVVALLDKLGGPAALVGHSYGGLIAAHVAIARPTLVTAMALFEPVTFGVLDADTRAGLATLGLEYTPGVGGDERWLAQFVDWWNGPGAWQALSDDTRASFRQVGWKLFQEVSSLVADQTPAAAYAVVTAPTLVLGGERTPHVEHLTIDALARALPRAEQRILAGMGHMGPITHAAEVNAAIVAHLHAHVPT